MGLCASKTSDPVATTGSTTAGGTAGTGGGDGRSGNANASANGASVSLGSLQPVPMGSRDSSFPSVVGPPSLRKQPSHQAVVSMTNLLNGKCRFAGTVTEEDNKDIPVASADGDLRTERNAQGLAHTLSIVMKGKQKWRVTLQIAPSPQPKPADVDGEESCPVTAELLPGDGSGPDSVAYRMSVMDVDVHSMGTLRLIEEAHMSFVHSADPQRTITVRGSLSWRLVDDKTAAAVGGAPVATPAAAPAAAPAAVPAAAPSAGHSSSPAAASEAVPAVAVMPTVEVAAS